MEIKNVASSLTQMRSFLMQSTSSSAQTLSPTLMKSASYQVHIGLANSRESGGSRGTRTLTTQICALSTSHLTALGVILLESKPTYINSQLFLQLLRDPSLSLKRTISAKRIPSSQTTNGI